MSIMSLIMEAWAHGEPQWPHLPKAGADSDDLSGIKE